MMTREAAENAVYAYEHCSDCSRCALNYPGAYRCGYLYDEAVKALSRDSREVTE